jgi:hypothetical protein
MMRVRLRFSARCVLFCRGLLAAAVYMLCTESAQADVLRLGYDDTQVDPAEDFDSLCLGDTPADDCDTRAALIEGELVMMLSQLEGDSAAETVALFRDALELDSPVVRAIAVRYFARAEAPPEDFLAKVKTFFLGPDAPLGVAAAEALGGSEEVGDQELADLYREQRERSDYALGLITEATADEVRLACTNDGRLDLMASFAEAEQFSPADRLLMYDRFVRAQLDPSLDYPVTSFVTEASVDQVAEFFSDLFGEPYGPVSEAQARIQTLTGQLAALQAAAAGGDQAAIRALSAAIEELTAAQQVLSLGIYLQLPGIHAENDLVWLDGDIEDVATKLPRAVTVGEDPLLEKTVIRYINAPTELSTTPGGGRPNGAGGDSGMPGEGSSGQGTGGATEPESPPAASDDGCGCAIPGNSSHRSAHVATFAFLALMLWRARRGTRRVR